ncbi:MAG: lasso peptide biosynthesis B2 protein [Bryobacterales bacterium]|nr:lasso peptide biosynthesis B2 protein [Bryobacterales bacterium]
MIDVRWCFSRRDAESGPEDGGVSQTLSYRTLAALVQLAVFASLRWFSGFAGVRRWVTSCPIRSCRRHPDAITATLLAVDRACAYFPANMQCLGRAAIATRLLRRQGFPARMVVGVQRMPFGAHAWVELDGEPVYGLPERYSCYEVIDRS